LAETTTAASPALSTRQITSLSLQANDTARLLAMWREAAELLAKSDARFSLAADADSQWLKALAQWLANPDTAVFVLDIEGKNNPMGYIVGGVAANAPGFAPAQIGVIYEQAVDFHAKQGGLGRLLLASLQGWFAARNISQIEARIAVAQPIAQAFWRSSKAAKRYETMHLVLPTPKQPA
jgi:hypothetical protein